MSPFMENSSKTGHLLMPNELIALPIKLKCQLHLFLYHAPYYQCANPSIIVRLHDQGASTI